MQEVSQQVISTKPTARSAVTNGSILLQGVDGRSSWARRARDLIEAHVADLGGHNMCSEGERSIVRRISVMTVELERMEQKFALADEINGQELDLYQRTAGSLRRLLESVGIQRRPRSVGASPMLLGDD